MDQQKTIFLDTLRHMYDAGALTRLMLIGSWAEYLYQESYFNSQENPSEYVSMFKT